MDVKIVLSLTVPGSVMFTQEDCENNKRLAKEHKMRVTLEKKGGKKVTETLVFFTRKTKDAVRKIKMSREAYDYMIETPSDVKLSAKWKSMRKNERLRNHFDLIAKDFNAKNYDYEVLED